jgi:hypothetical protein
VLWDEKLISLYDRPVFKIDSVKWGKKKPSQRERVEG